MNIFEMILKQTNTLIAGVTGSGKSVLLNGIMYSLLTSSTEFECYLIDLKYIGLAKFADLPQCRGFAGEVSEAIDMLESIKTVMKRRYSRLDVWDEISTEPPIYVIIDELTDLTLQGGADFRRLLQSLNQLGRAANIHIIAACQSPSKKSLPAEIAINFTCKIALHCSDKMMSKQILGFDGAERLPAYGVSLASIGGNLPEAYTVPKIGTDDLKKVVFSECRKHPEPEHRATKHATQHKKNISNSAGCKKKPRKNIFSSAIDILAAAAVVYSLASAVFYAVTW